MTHYRNSLLHLIFLFAFLAFSLPCAAASPDFLEQQNLEPALSEAKEAIAQKKWAVAGPLLDGLLQKHTDNSDLFTLAAFVCRKSGNLACAFEKYRKALQINPGNLKALEYLGEAHLQNNDPASAKIQLGLIENFSSKNTEEWKDLDEDIKTYLARKK
jgi:Tfp pilus assembly protein PilF